VFQNGKEAPGKNPGKAGNCGDKAYFILKRAYCNADLIYESKKLSIPSKRPHKIP